jgi:hypothetical protein
VPVLVEHFAQLHIHNPCPIPAEIQLFIEGEESAFAVGQRSAVLEPGTSLAVPLSCLLDEVQPFKDVLHMLVSDGQDVAVTLEASGACLAQACGMQHSDDKQPLLEMPSPIAG